MSTISYAEFLSHEWELMCTGFGTPESEVKPLSEHVRTLLAPWGEWPVEAGPRYPSFVSGDGFPAEMSVSLTSGNNPEFRILFESLGDPATSLSCRAAGVDLTYRLAEQHDVYLDAYERVQDIFLPPDRPGGLIWHSIAWRPGSTPKYKVYLGPQIFGIENAYEVVGEAMSALGMGASWKAAAERISPRQRGQHELDFFALDLSDAPSARAKVYLRHHTTSAAGLDEIARLSVTHDSARALGAYRRIVDDTDRVLTDFPLSCLAFRRGTEGVAESTTYLRLTGIADSGAAVGDLIENSSDIDLDSTSYRQAMATLNQGQFPAAHELVGLRSRSRTIDVTTYVRFGVYAQPQPHVEYA